MNGMDHKPVDKIVYAREAAPVEDRSAAWDIQFPASVRKMSTDTQLHPNCTAFVIAMIIAGKGAMVGHALTHPYNITVPTAEQLAPVPVSAERRLQATLALRSFL